VAVETLARFATWTISIGHGRSHLIVNIVAR
jgi:hypothetical protein